MTKPNIRGQETTLRDRGSEITARGRPRGNFCWQQNELYDLFQPIIGPTGHLIYTHLTRKAFDAKFRCSVRELAHRTGLSHTTVSRAITVLECVGVLRVRTGGGNRANEIELVDLELLAQRLGATYNKRTGMFGFPEETTSQLRAAVVYTQQRSQGKKNVASAIQPKVEARFCSQSRVEEGDSIFLPHSKRDASVSSERHERHTKETQTGSQQIKENRTQENNPSPTPSHIGDLWKSKDLSDERTAGLSLKRFRDLFCGAMDQMKDHLVNPSRPQLSHLEDGYEEWQRFGFESLGLVAVRETDAAVRLVLCAIDPERAEAGLEKYRATWDAAVRHWFPCEVEIEWQPIPRAGEGRVV